MAAATTRRERHGAAAHQPLQIAALVVELAAADANVGVGQHGRQRAWHAKTLEHAAVLLRGHVHVGHRLAGAARHLGGKLRHGERVVAGKLVDLVLVALAGEHLHCRRGILRAGRRGDAALAAAAHHLAVLHRSVEVLRVVLHVPAVAQQHERQLGLAQVGLGGAVIGREHVARGVGVQDAGVGHEPDASLLRRVDRGAVLALAMDQVGG